VIEKQPPNQSIHSWSTEWTFSVDRIYRRTCFHAWHVSLGRPLKPETKAQHGLASPRGQSSRSDFTISRHSAKLFSGMHYNFSLRLPLHGIGLLVVLAWVSGCSPDEKPEPVVPPVQTLVLGTGSEVSFRRFPGEVAAADSSNMSFDVPGRLIEFPATQGMVFKFGELLGRLDETNFVARVDAARADFVNAHAELPGAVNCISAA
jgi:hypothetical protein